MKNLTDMTIEELAAMKAALEAYFFSTQDEAWREIDKSDNEKKADLLEALNGDLALINGLIRNVIEAEAEWKKTHTINFREKLRRSKSG